MSRDYRKLQVFKFTDELVIMVYTATRTFPKSEMFGLTSQLRRASVSVPTNIVEGSHRSTIGDYLRFLDIGLGSLAETGYLLNLSNRLGFIDTEPYKKLYVHYGSCIRMLKALINSLRKTLKRQRPKPTAKSPKPNTNAI